MIKNVLYSLLLHSTFAFLIYFNFHHIIQENINLKDGVSVELISLQDTAKQTKTFDQKEDNKIETKPISRQKIKNIKPVSKSISDQKIEFKKLEEEKIKENTKKINEESFQQNQEISKEAKQDQVVDSSKSISDVENIESLQLSLREKFNIQAQLRACYKRSLMNIPKSGFFALVKVAILQDGTIDFDPEKIIDANRYAKDMNYKVGMDGVMRALELCSPLRNMPLDKYEIWREFTIEFSE